MVSPKWSQMLLVGAVLSCGNGGSGGDGPLAVGGAGSGGGGATSVGGSDVVSTTAGSTSIAGSPSPTGGSAPGGVGSNMGPSGGQESEGGTAGAPMPWQPAAGQLPVDQILLAEPEIVASIAGSEHNEGPAYRDGNVFWCDSGGLFRLMQDQSLFLYVENETCGAAFAASDGSLLLAFGQQGIARIAPNGLIEQLAALPMGGFANDITLDTAGNVYVSNTGRGEVLRVTPGGLASVVARDLPGANGLEVDPAGELLYVNQSSQNRVVRLQLGPGDQLGPPEVFTEDVQVPDGAAFDAWGNYWVTEFTSERIRIFSPQGSELTILDSGGDATTNLTFGGPGHDVLYVTGGGTLRRIPIGVPGFPGHRAAAAYTAIGPLPFTVTDSPQ